MVAGILQYDGNRQCTTHIIGSQGSTHVHFSFQHGICGGSIHPFRLFLQRPQCLAPTGLGRSAHRYKILCLIMDDPDAPIGTFVHWVIYNIPASSRGLPEAVPTNGQLVDGTLQGNNGSGKAGYTGPCPPSGTHRYFFKLYALDNVLSLPSGPGKDQLLQAMQGHILAQGELMGTFSK